MTLRRFKMNLNLVELDNNNIRNNFISTTVEILMILIVIIRFIDL